MTLRKLFVFIFISISFTVNAQWELDLGAGIGAPITGYGDVLKNGWLIKAGGKYRLGKGNFALGMQTHFTRLQKDKDPNDAFQNARMTLAPILFTAEYTFPTKGNLQPYITGGLGLTLFSLNYDISPSAGESIFNVSFSMMPQVGLRYKAAEHVYIFADWGLVLLADGPPIGFPKGGEMTGYHGVTAGVSYRF